SSLTALQRILGPDSVALGHKLAPGKRADDAIDRQPVRLLKLDHRRACLAAEDAINRHTQQALHLANVLALRADPEQPAERLQLLLEVALRHEREFALARR